MKQMTEAALREMLERVYDQAYEDGQYRVDHPTDIEPVDQAEKAAFIDAIVAEV